MAATVKAGPRSRPVPMTPQVPEPAVMEFSFTSEPEPEERKPFFTIDGTEYTILANPGPGIAVEAADIMTSDSPGAMTAAEKYIMEQMLGKDGWAALRRLARERRITKEQYKALVIEVRTVAAGAMEDDDPNF